MPVDTTEGMERAVGTASETQTLVAVSAAHLVSHFYIMVLPVLLPLLGRQSLACPVHPDSMAEGTDSGGGVAWSRWVSDPRISGETSASRSKFRPRSARSGCTATCAGPCRLA